jgi:hypothetical protein
VIEPIILEERLISLTPEESLVFVAAYDFGRAAAAYADAKAGTATENRAFLALEVAEHALLLAARRLVTPGVMEVYQRSATLSAPATEPTLPTLPDDGEVTP